MLKAGSVRIRIITNIKKEKKERTKFWDAVEKGEKIKSRHPELVLTPKTFSKVFSPERIRLIFTIRNEKIHSISGLAKELERPFESVDRDIKYLEGLGLIKLRKKEKAKIPIVERRFNFIL
ncbi:hypothetical protein J4414_01360 [Candidatus Woesearchaeota archaeon]|nr:hypothetical protein [Candidatus Woesearchaeota archaeon]